MFITSQLSNRIRNRAACWLPIAAIAAAVLLAGCGGSDEADEGGAETKVQADTGPGEITSFRLANGITVYFREDHSQAQTAVVVLYKAGVYHEEKGYVHASRLLPHLMIYSPTASFAPEEAVEKLGQFSRVNGEVVGEFTRFDYMSSPDQLELIFKIESERVTSIRFEKEQLEPFANKCVDDVYKNLQRPNFSLSKYGLMALNQAYNHGLQYVPVLEGVHNLTVGDVERFRRAHYRLDEMVIVVVGDFESGNATDLINKYFGSVEFEPLDFPDPEPTGEDMEVVWDIPATVMFSVYPGPYADDTERIALTMFGTLLNRQLKADSDLLQLAKATFCSNTIYPVGELPFFVYAEYQPRAETVQIRRAVRSVIEESLAQVDKKSFETMKINLVDFFQSSILDAQRNFTVVAHHKALDQEAVNIGMKHYLKKGATTEEFVEKIRAITYEEARRYLDAALAPERRIEFVFEQG